MAFEPRGPSGKKPTSRNPITRRTNSPLDALRKGSPPPLRPPTGRNPRPQPTGEEGEEELQYITPAKKSNTPIIVGIAGGVVVLLLIIIIASSSGGKRYAPQRPQYNDPAPVAVVEEKSTRGEIRKFNGSVGFYDTGAILFVCANTPTHEDKEVEFNLCPKCEKKNFFCIVNSGYFCWNCETELPSSVLKCATCGRGPQKTVRIKHK